MPVLSPVTKQLMDTILTVRYRNLEAEQMLEILRYLSTFNSHSGTQWYVSMKVRFAERFRSAEERNKACCEFYETVHNNECMVS